MKKQVAVLAGLGFELTGLILAGFFAGQALDRWQDWNGLGVALGVGLGFFGWLWHVYKILSDGFDDDHPTDQ